MLLEDTTSPKTDWERVNHLTRAILNIVILVSLVASFVLVVWNHFKKLKGKWSWKRFFLHDLFDLLRVGTSQWNNLPDANDTTVGSSLKTVGVPPHHPRHSQ